MGRRRALRYLHIEENMAEVDRIQQVLREAGYEPQVQVVLTPDELADAVVRAEWDLILTDWALPTYSAKAVLAQLAERAVDLPIIIVSAVSSEDVIVDAIKSGVHDYVIKGRLARLGPAIEEALRENTDQQHKKVMEEALHESQDRLDKLVEGAPLGIVFLDEQSRYGKVNKAFCNMVGYREEELIGEIYTLITHPDDLSLCKTLITEMPINKQPGFQLEQRYIRKDGQTLWVKVHPVNLEPLGNSRFPLAAFIENVSERRGIAARLRLSQFSIDQAGEAIFWSDPSGRIIDVNHAACAMLGYSIDELCRLGVHEVVSATDPHLWSDYWAKLKQRELVRFETEIRSKDGQLIPIDLVVSYLKFNGEEYSCSFGRDISSRKQAEATLLRAQAQLAQAEKLEVVGRLTGGIAHDFNNFLTFIIGQSELLMGDRMLTDLARNSIAQIRDAGIRASGLTRQLLLFTRQQVMRPQDVHIPSVIKAMHMLLKGFIGENIQFRLDLDDLSGIIRADPSQIEQIIMNLVINARDAMPDGGTVTLKTSNVELDAAFFEQQGLPPRLGGYCMLSIQDTGIGMDEQTMGRAFEPFFSTKGLGKGTGLGLSTIQRILLECQGLITVSSHPGKGTTFRAYFPHTTSVGHQAKAAGPTLAVDVRGTETILLIEDESLVRQLLKVVLSSRGYTILEAETGKAACHTAARHPGEIHLILSDVILPDDRGPIVAERLREIRPGIKMMFMSGYLGVDSDQEHILLQQHAFIQKPFTLPALIEMVHRLLASA